MKRVVLGHAASARRSSGLSILAVLGAIALGACSEDEASSLAPTLDASAGVESPADEPDAGADPVTPGEPAQSCEPGEPGACIGSGGCRGSRVCNESGTGFGACSCPSSVGNGGVGSACETAEDCRAGTRCLAADSNDYFGNGGPAGGYCSADCQTTADCQAIDPLATCALVGDAGLCLRGCLSKDPEPGEGKCLDRPDVVCRSVVAGGREPLLVERQEGRCEPRCGSDAECPAGRVCHAQAGFCTDFPPPGGPVGAPCEDDDECSGRLCDGLSRGEGVCTAPCVLGELAGCGFAADDPERGVACVTPLVQVAGFSEGLGDVGICREVCDVDADCLQVENGWSCTPQSEAFAEFFGRSGACTPNSGG